MFVLSISIASVAKVSNLGPFVYLNLIGNKILSKQNYKPIMVWTTRFTKFRNKRGGGGSNPVPSFRLGGKIILAFWYGGNSILAYFPPCCNSGGNFIPGRFFRGENSIRGDTLCYNTGLAPRMNVLFWMTGDFPVSLSIFYFHITK